MKFTKMLKARVVVALLAIFGIAATSLPAVADDLIAEIQSEKMHADRFAALLRSMAICNLPPQIAVRSKQPG